MKKRAGLKGSLIAAALGTVLLLPTVGIGGSAALDNGGLEVRSVNTSDRTITATAGMNGLADEDPVDNRKMCPALDIEITDELFALSERNVGPIMERFKFEKEKPREGWETIQGPIVTDLEKGSGGEYAPEGVVAFIDYGFVNGDDIIRGAATRDTPDENIFVVRPYDMRGDGVLRGGIYYCSNGGG